MKADVYSFGVLILEIVSGQSSSKSNWGGSNKVLLEWVREFNIEYWLFPSLSFHLFFGFLSYALIRYYLLVGQQTSDASCSNFSFSLVGGGECGRMVFFTPVSECMQLCSYDNMSFL